MAQTILDEFELPQKLIMTIELCEIRFRLACDDGDLDEAKKILSQQPNINNFNDAFFIACYAGHLHIAQWLLSIKPTIDISMHDNRALQAASREGYTHIVQWLKNLK